MREKNRKGTNPSFVNFQYFFMKISYNSEKILFDESLHYITCFTQNKQKIRIDTSKIIIFLFFEKKISDFSVFHLATLLLNETRLRDTENNDYYNKYY